LPDIGHLVFVSGFLASSGLASGVRDGIQKLGSSFPTAIINDITNKLAV
jgi:hypothetical protein